MHTKETDSFNENRPDSPVAVSAEWQQLDFSAISGLVMLVGSPDTGKTTLFRYLGGRLASIQGAVFAVDADPGQGRMGPPTTISLGIIKEAGAFSTTEDIWHRFVGATTPAGHMLQMLTGCGRLVQKARDMSAAPIIMDTTGLVDPLKGGARLKLAKVDLLQPSVLIVLQREQELENWLRPLRISRRIKIIDMPCASAVRQRDLTERQGFREASFQQYFKDAVIQSFYWPHYGIFPELRFYIGRLLAFEDKAGFALGLGIVRGIDIASNTVMVFTPLAEADKPRINAIQLGDVVVDAKDFSHTLTHPKT